MTQLVLRKCYLFERQTPRTSGRLAKVPDPRIELRIATYKVAVLPLNQTGIGNQS